MHTSTKNVAGANESAGGESQLRIFFNYGMIRAKGVKWLGVRGHIQTVVLS